MKFFYSILSVVLAISLLLILSSAIFIGSVDNVVYGDVDGDGIVGSNDIILMQQYVAEIIDYFPVEEKKEGITKIPDLSVDDKEWKNLNGLTLTNVTHSFPNTEVFIGETFLNWRLISAYGKNYGNFDYGVKAEFAGDITIEGVMSYNMDNSGYLENKIVFHVDPEYASLFPLSIYDERELWFVVENTESAKKMFKITDEPCSLRCKVSLNKYKIFLAPNESTNSAVVSGVAFSK